MLSTVEKAVERMSNQDLKFFPWEVINEFPLDDLVRYCRTNKLAAITCSDPTYFQQRLIAKGGDLIYFQQSPFTDPIAKYVYALALSQRVMTDPGAIIYMINTDILFPEITYPPRDCEASQFAGLLSKLIGLSNVALRMIKENQLNDLLSVLRMYPSIPEQKAIIGALHWKEYQTGKDWTSFQYVVFTYIWDQIRDLYLPEDLPLYPLGYLAYRIYLHGYKGENIKISNLTPSQVLTYFYGLIDGNYMTLLFSKLKEGYRPLGYSSEWTLIKWRTLKYIIANRPNLVPINMLPRGGGELVNMYKFAVEQNNTSIVWYLLSNYRHLTNITVYPGSIEMVDLLKLYQVKLTDVDILAGAMKHGPSGRKSELLQKFRLWNHITKDNKWIPKLNPSHDIQQFYREIFSNTPPYMLRTYIQGSLPYDSEIRQMIDLFIENKDFYRLEVILNSVGIQCIEEDVVILRSFEGSQMIPLSIPKIEFNDLLTNEMVKIFGLDLSYYPKLREILEGK